MVTYKIDLNDRLIRTECSGNVTLPEVVAHFQEIAADPECPAYLDVLLDMRTLSSLPKSGELQAVTREVRKVRDKVRFGFCAIVVEREVLFGMFRMFEVFAQDHFAAIHVFRVLSEAESWLAAQRLSAK